MYKISIIIPVYNTGQYLDECMDSLKKQTIGFENLEVILADDCSTDNSREIMRKYEQQHANVKCIYLNENSGAAGRPRNEAMKLAGAPYLMFLDSDDIYYESACENLLYAVRQTNAELVSGYFSTFDDTHGILEENIFAGRNIEEKVYQMPEDIAEAAKFRIGFSCKIYSRKIIEKENILFPERIIGQDSVFMWNYLFHIKTAYYASVPVLKYRQRKENNPSVTFSLTHRHFLSVLESLRMIWNMFKEYGMEDKIVYGFGDINPYYLNQMIDSSLSQDALQDILGRWAWILKISQKEHENDIYTRIIMKDIQKDDFQGAAKTISLLREQKVYVTEIEKAKNWWQKQAEAKEQEMKKKTEARDWWQKQAENKDQEIWSLQRENTQLRKWVEELEEAKKFFLDKLSRYEKEQIGG